MSTTFLKTRKGRKLRRKSEAATWDEAILIAGTDEALVNGQNPKTVSGWRARREVPGYAIAPFLLSWWRGTHKPPAPDPEMEKLMDMVRAIIESDNKLVKDALRTNLEVFRLFATKGRRRR